jgi:integrase
MRVRRAFDRAAGHPLPRLLAQGVDPRTIMKTLGHSQISLTLNTYSHVLPALQAEAAANLDAILSR